jgi:hypothetical protein
MAQSPKIVVGAINIASDPHPPGIYRRLFQKMADHGVPIWGNDWAKITPPQDRETEPPSFYGRILVWTEIDKDGKWLNQEKNKEATPNEKAAIQIPNTLDPNFRSFNFVFLEDRHLLVLEYKNELGEHFGAVRAERLFSSLFSEELLDQDDPDVSVTVVPSHEGLKRIYAIPRLRRLEIFVLRPNADDLAKDQKKLLDRLMKQGAKSQSLELRKRAGVKTITPDEETKTLAAIAADNGYVTGEGKRDDDTPVEESTKDHPKTVTVKVEGPTSIAAFFNAVRRF